MSIFESIFTDWEFISKIPKDMKPCFSDKTLIGCNEWFSTFKRRYKGEKGERGVIYVKQLIDSTENYIKSADNISVKKLKDLIENSLEGMKNLVETYKKDQQDQVSKDYEELLEKVKIIIKNIIKRKNNFFGYVPKML